MYNTFDRSERIFVYRFNTHREAYELVRVCDSRKEFAEYAASLAHMEFVHNRSLPVGKILDKLDILNDVDLTGKDRNSEYHYIYDYTGLPTRDGKYTAVPDLVKRIPNKMYIIYDGFGRIVNPSDMAVDIELEILHEKAWYDAGGLRKRWYGWRPYPVFVYRRGPVPGIHKYKGGGFGRSEKTWFHNYRMDHIPEYREFVRFRARVPDTWDSEPLVEITKSWKRQAKCRHQWQKHKTGKKDTAGPHNKRFIREEDPWSYCGNSSL